MPFINKIEITGFKAFPDKFTLLLEGKHLLIYGENGSGKSSIFYALHCIFQSPLKSDGGKKYFNVFNDNGSPNNQHLKNINNIGADSRILIDFTERHPWIYTVDKNGYNTTLIDGRHPLPANITGCFINHQFLFHFFNFRNSQRINLFPVFIKDILPFIKDERSGYHIGEMYEILNASIIKKGNQVAKEYIENINYFNEQVREVIENVNLYASDIYNKYFKDNDDNELQIRLRYDSNIDKPENDPMEYWLKYDRIIEYIKVNETIQERPSRYKRLNNPFIGMEVSEKLQDRTMRSIINPHVHFNEAKLTAIALSIRFSLLNLDKVADGRFLALDDMLISLDMSNRAKVVEFLLSISDKYKIYLFTHDKAFFEYFKHKSKRHKSAEEWTYKEIYMTENKMPYLKDSESYLGEAEHYINQQKFEIAGNFLRKETEAFCKRFLPPKWQLTKDYTNLDLNGMIQNCKKYAYESGIADLSLFDELDDYRKFILNSSSHDSYDVVKFESEVRKCLETLKSLSKTTSKPVLKYGDNVTFTLKTPQPNVKEYKFDIQICDELRVIEIPGQPKVLSKVMINYYVYEDGVKGNKQSSNQTLKKFYDDNYKRSDKTENPDYLEGIKLVFNGLPISSLL